MTEFVINVNKADAELHGICLLKDQIYKLVYKRKDDFSVESSFTNIIIGTFSTSHTRIELYNIMDLAGENQLYVDMGDSRVILSKPDLLRTTRTR